MKKAFAVFSVMVLASAASAQVRFQGTLEQALAKARADKKLVLILFDASG